MHKGFSVPMTVNVAAAPPGRVDGLFFGAPSKSVATLDALMRNFAALPGHVSVLAARLDEHYPRSDSRTRHFVVEALGSAFKQFSQNSS